MSGAKDYNQQEPDDDGSGNGDDSGVAEDVVEECVAVYGLGVREHQRAFG